MSRRRRVSIAELKATVRGICAQVVWFAMAPGGETPALTQLRRRYGRGAGQLPPMAAFSPRIRKRELPWLQPPPCYRCQRVYDPHQADPFLADMDRWPRARLAAREGRHVVVALCPWCASVPLEGAEPLEAAQDGTVSAEAPVGFGKLLELAVAAGAGPAHPDPADRGIR